MVCLLIDWFTNNKATRVKQDVNPTVIDGILFTAKGKRSVTNDCVTYIVGGGDG